MPGPAPKPDNERRRRNATVPMTQLPAEGRQGPAPDWPLNTKANAGEARVWEEIWTTPQAVAWERLGWTRTVGRYVRMLVQSEKRGALVGVAAEVRQLEDRLGLTPMSMLRLRWEIVVDEVTEARDEQTKTPRLRAVDPKGVDSAAKS